MEHTPFSLSLFLSLFIPLTKIKRDAYAHTLQIDGTRFVISATIFVYWIFEFINLWIVEIWKIVVQNNLSGLILILD